ncbi:Hypothetical predicted protein, partial [Pelobates cultripes]
MADAHIKEPQDRAPHNANLTGSHNNIGDQLEAIFNHFWAALEERRRLHVVDTVPMPEIPQHRE